MTYDKLNFATPGLPLSTPTKGTEAGIRYTAELGLDAMELEFVHSIYLSEEKARGIGEIAKESNILLTIHGPYTLNLNGVDPLLRQSTIDRIVKCARVGHAAGVKSVTFHPAFYGKDDHKEVYNTVRNGLQAMLDQCREEKLSPAISPETTGKPSQFGSLEELVQLAKELEGLRFCLDFAHLHARSNGKYNTLDEFRQIFDYIGQELGNEFLKSMHMHYSGLTYSEKGERKHLPFLESDANYQDLLKTLKEYDVRGILVVESPLVEEEAKWLKQQFDELK
ncbi:MAG: TIM barrel protein [bacterium]